MDIAPDQSKRTSHSPTPAILPLLDVETNYLQTERKLVWGYVGQ